MMSGEAEVYRELDASTSVLLPSTGSGSIYPSDIKSNMSNENDEVNDLTDRNGAVKITRKYVPVMTSRRTGCHTKRGRYILLCLGGLLVGTSLVLMVAGTIRLHQCQDPEIPPFWNTNSLKVDVENMVTMNNYALEKPTRQSSTHVLDPSQEADPVLEGYSEFAVDGDINTCSRTDSESSPWWRVDLGKQRPIHYILVQGKASAGLRDIVVSLENDSMFLDTGTPPNRTTCLIYNGEVHEQSFLTTCDSNANARYIIIQSKSRSRASTSSLVLCEVMVTQR